MEPPKKAEASHYLILDDGKKLLLASYPGKWKVVLAVSNDKGVTQTAWNLVVEGVKPTPPKPDPDNPKPPPDPDVPDNPVRRRQSGKGIYNAAMKSTSPTRLADAKGMIGKLQALRPSIAGATAVSQRKAIEDIMKALASAVSQGVYKNHWSTQFVTYIAAPMVVGVKDKDTALVAIDQMILGLKAVK